MAPFLVAIWTLFSYVLLQSRAFCVARPRGDAESDEHRQLKGMLSGTRGGAAGRADPKFQVRRDPVFLSPNPIPKALSDHTVSVHGGLMYIAGGCDSPNGNQYAADLDTYICDSLSDSLYSFDPRYRLGTGLYAQLADLPRPRYRHTSAVRAGKIWLIGGRDVGDNLLDMVDVYDVGTDVWTSFPLPTTNQLSDHASFVQDDFVYVVGGYDHSYGSRTMVYRIDAVQSISTGALVLEQVSPLAVGRGDLVAAQTGGYAYVAGGYTNSACTPLDVVERYEFSTGLWSSISSLTHARSDFEMVALSGIVIALGGERLSDGFCAAANSDLSTGLLAVDTIEILGRDTWLEFALPLPEHRFRSVAVPWAPTNSIYAFGGQVAYDAGCNCFATSNEVEVYRGYYDAAVDLLETASPTDMPTSAPTEDPGIALTVGNDLCEDAVEMEVIPSGLGRNAAAYGNTEAATADTGAPTCDGIKADTPGVWFNVVGAEGIMTAFTCGAFTDYDTKLTVYKGSCGNLECVAGDDDGCGDRKAQVSWFSERGEIYRILVHGWQTDPTGNYVVWVQTRIPQNDLCAYAQGPLAVGDSVDGSTIYAGLNFGGSGASGQNCGGAYGNVEGIWYYTIGTGNVMIADTCSDRTNYDTKIHIFTGDCQKEGDSKKLECVEGNDNNIECGLLTDRRSLVRWQSELGTKYYIFVHGFQAVPSKGFFILTIGEE